MDRIISMIIRQVVRQLVGQGVRGAMRAGTKALARRGDRKAATPAAADEQIDQDPSVTYRRRRHPDERRGDEVLYPTDDYTEGMQPRR